MSAVLNIGGSFKYYHQIWKLDYFGSSTEIPMFLSKSGVLRHLRGTSKSAHVSRN